MLEVLLLVAAVMAAALGLLNVWMTRRKNRAKPVEPALGQKDGTINHTYDPKEGLAIVTGTPSPPVTIKADLTPEQLVVVDRYLTLGKELGLAISYFPHGASVKESFLDEFIEAERQYLELGFKAISLHAFEGLGGWNQPLPADEQACVMRPVNAPADPVGPSVKERLKEFKRLY